MNTARDLFTNNPPPEEVESGGDVQALHHRSHPSVSGTSSPPAGQESAPQVPAKATSGDSGSNVEVDRRAGVERAALLVTGERLDARERSATNANAAVASSPAALTWCGIPITAEQAQRSAASESTLRERRAYAGYVALVESVNRPGAVNCARCSRVSGFSSERQGGWCRWLRRMVSSWHPCVCNAFREAA